MTSHSPSPWSVEQTLVVPESSPEPRLPELARSFPLAGCDRAFFAARYSPRDIIFADIPITSFNRSDPETQSCKTAPANPSLCNLVEDDFVVVKKDFRERENFAPDLVRIEMSAAINELCGPGPIGVGLWRAARLTGLTQGQCSRLRYENWLTVPAHVADAVRHALAKQRETNKRRQAIEAEIQARLQSEYALQATAESMAHADPEFFEPEIEFARPGGGPDSEEA